MSFVCSNHNNCSQVQEDKTKNDKIRRRKRKNTLVKSVNRKCKEYKCLLLIHTVGTTVKVDGKVYSHGVDVFIVYETSSNSFNVLAANIN